MNYELRPALETEVELLTEMSRAAFDTDVCCGNDEPGGPPDYDSVQWHREMMMEGKLFTFLVDNEKVGGAVVCAGTCAVYVGRVFLAPAYMGKGFGLKLMTAIETCFKSKLYKLDTPVWNTRTNRFYPRCGYVEVSRDEDEVHYEKRLHE